jgi:hypothetical protein
MKKILLIFTILVAFSCSPPTAKHHVVDKTSLGKITSATVVPTSFNESVKMQVTTEKAFFVIREHVFVPIGSEATLNKLDSGRECVTWDGADSCYYINR